MKKLNVVLALVLIAVVIGLLFGIPELARQKIGFTEKYQIGLLVSFIGVIIGLTFIPERFKKILLINGFLLYVGLVTIDYVLYSIQHRVGQNVGMNDDDNRSVLEVVADLRNDGVSAYAAGGPTYELTNTTLQHSELVPIAGIPNTHYVFCREKNGYIFFQSDHYGFRNSKAWDANADIVLLGDSYGHGACMPFDKTIAGWLERKYKVFNLSISGNGPLEMLAIQKEYAGLLRPKYTVWLFYAGNDIGNLNNAMAGGINERGLIQYLKRDFTQNLVGRQKELTELIKESFNSNFEEAFQEEVDSQRKDVNIRGVHENVFYNVMTLTNMARFIWNRGFVSEQFEYSATVWSTFNEVLKEAKRTAESMNSQLVVVILHPVYSHGAKWLSKNRLALANKAKLIGENLGISVYDTYDMMEKLKTGADSGYSYGRDGGHHNEQGYRAVSEVIDQAIVDIEGK